MRNWEIEATIEIWRLDNLRALEKERIGAWPPRYPGYFGLREFTTTSVYSVELHIPVHAVINATLDRRVDSDGFTTDSQPRQEKTRENLYLALGWDRDHGKVGAYLDALRLQGTALEPTRAGETIATTLPAGAFDKETPPTPPPANPRPTPRSNFNWRP
jgi:hypothetical protein